MKWFAILGALVLVGFAAYELGFPTYAYRYRIELALSVDEKIYTGSSVIEVVWQCGFKIADSGRCSSSLYGQAPVVDIGPQGVIVAATVKTTDQLKMEPSTRCGFVPKHSAIEALMRS